MTTEQAAENRGAAAGTGCGWASTKGVTVALSPVARGAATGRLRSSMRRAMSWLDSSTWRSSWGSRPASAAKRGA